MNNQGNNSISSEVERVSRRMAFRFALFLGLVVIVGWPLVWFASLRNEIHTVLAAVNSALSNLVVLGDTFQINAFLDSLKTGGIMDDYVLRDIRTGLWITSSLSDPTEILHPGFSFSHGSLAWVSAQSVNQGTQAIAELTLRRVIPFSSLLAGPLVFAVLWFPIDRLIRLQLRRFSKRLVTPIQEFSSALQRIDALGESEIESVRRLNLEFRELSEVQESFCSMFDVVRIAEQRERELQTENKLGKLARQVAHDVRSPLAALKMAVGHLESSPALAAEIIRSATDRITSIARILQKEKSRRYPICPSPGPFNGWWSRSSARKSCSTEIRAASIFISIFRRNLNGRLHCCRKRLY